MIYFRNSIFPNRVFYEPCLSKKNIKLNAFFNENNRFRNTQTNKVEINNILFTRNNVILDTIEKMTNSPFIFQDEELEDSTILNKNKEIALSSFI